MARADLPPLPKPGDIVLCSIARRERYDGVVVDSAPAVVISVGPLPRYQFDPFMIDVYLFCEAVDLYAGPAVRAWSDGPGDGLRCWPRPES